MKKFLLAAFAAFSLLAACSKSADNDQKSPLDGISSQLIADWTDLHLRLIRNMTGVSHPAYSRHFSYTGIALYESLVHGDDKMLSVAPLLNGLGVLPAPAKGNRNYYPASANAVFATMFRFFYGAKEANKPLIDSLELAYRTKYQNEVKNNFNLDESAAFGKTIAEAVIEWSKQDGAAGASIPYTPLGEGYWEPTPPAFGAPAVPGWGNNRTLLAVSLAGTEPPAPLAFSKEMGTPFYIMVKEVYEASQSLTAEQKNIADFWDDLPNGKYISAFGHWVNILKQVLIKENTPLMKGAEAYLRLTVTMNESTIGCWKSKYTFHQLRPITYIRKYMNQPNWNSYIGTPAHPEYLAAHATISGSAAAALESVFGKNYGFTDRTYEYLGMPARNYAGFMAAGTEAGLSRLYGGIHYRPSIEAGKTQGLKVAENVRGILVTGKP